MKFSDMKYSRPDADALKARMEELTARLVSAKTFEDADSAFLDMERCGSEFDTLYTLVSIRHSIDTRDEFYSAETDFFDAFCPELEEYSHRWTLELLKSPFRPQLEAKYGRLSFINAELDLKTFSQEIIPELQRENALVTEYDKLIASAQIPFEGNVYTVSQLAPFKLDPDDGRRLAAWQAEAGFYRRSSEKLDSIYDELVHLRHSMGKKLGYGGYTELGYYRMTRNCYGKSDIERFRASVVKHLVPVADKIYRRQAKRLGKSYPMDFADNALWFKSGNATPCTDSAGILAHAKKFYHELSPETSEFIDFMYENALLDVLSRPGKAGGGYCTSLPDYRSPFIFANFNGTSGDVEVMTHEAGHAFANYLARNVVPLDCQWPSMEACEVHSMSMEFFAWPWSEGFFGGDTGKFHFAHLADALTFIPYGTMVDHFQHVVYEKPDMTPEERHGVWRELLRVYMPWMKLDARIPFYGEGMGWQRQMHIYQSPFYYIDYCLAQTLALQFWAMMQSDRDKAWKAYMRYTRPAGTKTFIELLEGAGLASPFDEDALTGVCAAASKWLDECDLTGIE